MMKPLYLDAPTVLSVRLEHQSLRIRSSTYADVWHPLARISRVILRGDITLSSGVIAACLAQQIPIAIADTKGDYVGICFGTDFKQQSLQYHVLELYESRSQLYILEHWFAAQQRRQVLRLQKRFRLPHEQLEPAAIKMALDTHICLNHHFYHWQSCLNKLIPMLAAQQTVLLRYFGFDSEILRPAPTNSGLLQQFIELLEWELWERAALGELPKSTQRKQLIHYYQQHSPHIERSTRFWIDRLWHRFYEVEHE